MTLNDAFLDVRKELRRAGITGCDVEARELLCKAMGLDENGFYAKRRAYIFEDNMKEIRRLLDLRLSGVPIQHIIGQWEFYGLPFKVTEDTLIPRSDTETLVEAALAFVNGRTRTRVLDLCCGTGCVGIALARFARNTISCILGDISVPALRVAKDNVALNRMTRSVSVATCDARRPCPDVFGSFDLITCNPPYIPTAEIGTLDPEVQREPALALDGGEDGLDFYRAICKNFRSAIREGGALMFEVGLGQYEQVREIMLQAGFEDIAVFRDLQAIERVVCGTVPYTIPEETAEENRTDVALSSPM